MGESFAYRDKTGKIAGTVTIYKHNFHFKKLTSFKTKSQDFKILLKTEQFSTLDDLLNEALNKIVNFIKDCEDNTEKLRLQNKYNGLNNVKRKIELAKKDYNDNPKNQIAYNRLLNLYNSLKNLI